MKQTQVWILAVVACLAVFMMTACGGSESGCQTREDCTTGLVCNVNPTTGEGACETPISCINDEVCPAGWECYIESTIGYCIISGSNVTGCTTDADCDITTQYCDLTTQTCKTKETKTTCQVQTDCNTATEYCNMITGYCEPITATDPCSPNPCTQLNKNVCSNNNGTALCTCNPNYVDDGAGNCVDNTTPVDPCDPNPCQEANKAVCTASGAQAICSCNQGYADDGAGNCVADTPVDPCTPNPCQEANKTVCTASGTQAICSCNNGYADDGAGNCVQQSTGDTTQAKACDTIPAASFETPLTNFCVEIDTVTLQTAAEACGTCMDVPAGVGTTLTMTDCNGNEMGGGPFDAMKTTEHYIFVLAPNAAGDGAELQILTIGDLTQFTCGQADYASVVQALQQKSSPKLIDSFPVSFDN